MRYLVDANVLSEATRPRPDPRVVDWLTDNESELAVDPIIVGEICFGILLLEPSRRRDRLEAWFEEGVRRLHCVQWDQRTGLQWAELLSSLRRRGQAMPVKDSLIAATAIANELEIATLNRRDFEPADVSLVDPTASG